MQQEATQELIVRQTGELLFVVMSRIAPAKDHLAIGKGNQAMVGDGHAMGVAAEILQYVFRTTEGTFQVDHPRLSKQWPQPSREDLGFGEQLEVFGKAELTILEGLAKCCNKLATENLAEYRFGQEVVVWRVHPTSVIERETTGRDDTMDMGMKPDLLIPSVQHAEKTNLCTEVSGIAGDFEKGFCTGAKQKIVKDLLVLQHQGCQAARKCEDHVQVAGGKKFSATCGNPSFAGGSLTLRAVAVPAAVIRDERAMCAAGALIEMPAERSRTTAGNGQQHFDMSPANPLVVSLDEGSSSGADEIGHL